MRPALLTALSLLLATPVARADDAPLPALLQSFRKLSGLQTHFREEKHIALLAAPLVTEGEIYFEAPDRLARETTKPSVTKMVINGNALSFKDAHAGETMQLDRNPVAKLFVDGFVKILAGDADALKRLYDLTFRSLDGDRWELHLKPKVAPMSDVIDAIDLAGRGVQIERMKMVETGGDETVTTFSATNTARVFKPDERAHLFQTGGR
jgi:outer membrane lipoprotein-sorting protein